MNILKNPKKIFIASTIICGLLVSGVALAAGPFDAANKNLGSALNTTGLSSDISTSIGAVVKGVLAVVGTLFLLLTVYAGITWMTAQGNEDKVTKAKGTIEAAVIGLFIVMAAYAITAFVTSKVGGPGSSDTCSSVGGSCYDATCTKPAAQNYECTGTTPTCCLP